jgi:hypothetical protein
MEHWCLPACCKESVEGPALHGRRVHTITSHCYMTHPNVLPEHHAIYDRGLAGGRFPSSTFLGAFVKLRKIETHLRHVLLSVCLQEQLGSHWDGFSLNLIFEYFVENMLIVYKFYLNLTRITGILHEYLCTFMIIYRSIHWEIFQTRGVE